MLRVYLPAFAAFLATAVVVFFLRPLARSLDFVDRPGGRKMHSDEIPVVGGLAMFVGLALGISLLPDAIRPSLTFVSLAFVFVVTGLLDDRFSLNPWVRLAIQASAAAAMIALAGLSVRFVGAPFGFGTVIFVPSMSVLLTVILVVGAVNALNMVDGIDGLAGSLGLVALVGIGMAAVQAADSAVFGVVLALGGAVTGFLLFNLPLGLNARLRTFMGDAGSMLIGFSLAWCLVSLSQNPSAPLAPVTLLWFVAVPIFDLISTASGRVARGFSPFAADTTHFHHALIHRGFSRPTAMWILVGLAVFWAATGVWLETGARAAEWMSLVGFLLAGVLTHVVIRYRSAAQSG